MSTEKSPPIIGLWSRHHTGLDLQSGNPKASYHPDSDHGPSLTGASTRGGPSRGGPSEQSQNNNATIAPHSLVELAERPRYKVGELLGQGGMGAVYRAEQGNLGRAVALKTLLSNGPRSARRFSSEARVTGSLDHPNIVPVHELGVSAGGQTLMAMKLVGGRSWRQVLEDPEKNGPGRGLEKELATLLAVCNAVAFAHSRGIAHCDLKPENVMVGAFGEVLLMDWGLALDIRDPKARAAQEARAPYAESLAAPCGTPCYMAPELAEGRGEDIGAWTDTYLLGALLYELLEGRPPHRGETLAAVLLAAADSRPPAFSDQSPAELRAIAARALSHKPEARYGSVTELQSALESYLAHRESTKISDGARDSLERCQKAIEENGGAGDAEGIYADFAEAVAGFKQAAVLWEDNPAAIAGQRLARLDYARAALAFGDLNLAEAQSARLEEDREAAQLRAAIADEKARRLKARRGARRLRWALAGALALLVLGLIVGLAYYSWTNAVIRREKERVLRRERISQDSLKLLVYKLGEVEAFRGTRLREIREDLLKEAVKGFERLRDTAAAEAPTSRGAARAQVELAQILCVRGDIDAGLAAFEQARVIQESLLNRGDQSRQLLVDMVATYNSIGRTRALRRELDAGLQAYRRALELANRALAMDPEDEDVQILTSNMSCALGGVLLRHRDLEGARAAFEEGAAGFQRLRERDPKSHGFEFYWLTARKGLASCMALSDDRAGAIACFEDCVTRARHLYETEESRLVGAYLVSAISLLGYQKQRAGDKKGALSCFEEAATLGRREKALDPDETSTQRLLVSALIEIGSLKRELGDLAGSAEQLREALALGRELGNLSPSDRGIESTIAHGIANLGVTLRANGDPAAALSLYDQSLAATEDLLRSEGGQTFRETLARTRLSRANALSELGKNDEARAEWDALIAEEPSFLAFLNRGLARYQLGERKEAIADFSSAILLDPTDPRGHFNRGYARYKLRELPLALTDLNKTIELDPKHSRAYRFRSAVHRMTGKAELALADAARALELDPKNAGAYYEQAQIYKERGDLKRALDLYNKGIAIAPNWKVHTSRGNIRLKLGQKEEALADWTRAIELDAKAHLAYRNRGIYYKNEGEPERAIQEYTKAIEARPDYIDAYLSRASLNYKRGALEPALADYRKLLKIAPRSRWAKPVQGRVREIEARLAEKKQGNEGPPNDG